MLVLALCLVSFNGQNNCCNVTELMRPVFSHILQHVMLLNMTIQECWSSVLLEMTRVVVLFGDCIPILLCIF